MILDKINSPADIKTLSLSELNELSNEVRSTLLQKLSEHGGHIGPNLGMVETTIALHYVFNSPIDKFVFDVSHQSYTHKMLTGRKEAFTNAANYDNVSGYSDPHESEHDFFVIGHTSTSVSLACGLAKGRDLTGGSENIVAIIGDGSLSGGEALEGLNNAAELNSNIIIIVNDNQMSIAENHGGLYQNLQLLRETNGDAPCNLFKAMGLDYHYIAQGNDIETLIACLQEIKDINHPIVLHINTLKGKGYSYAEEHKEAWHWGMPFDLATGKSKIASGESYGNLTGKYLLERMKNDPRIVVLTAGTPAVLGFGPKRRAEAGKQFVDVGIAEEHAIAMASGIAARGGKPVFGVFSSFIQRTYDQLSQDLCINRNPAVILLEYASVYALNDITHLGIFDMAMMSNIPNLVFLCPTHKEEYFAMLNWAIEQNEHPVAIRIPSNGIVERGTPCTDNFSILNRFKKEQEGEKIAILALGSFYSIGERTAQLIQSELGFTPTLINPRYASGIDHEMLEQLKANHSLVITIEDGVLDGGMGEKIARYYGNSTMKVLNYGLKKEFIDRYVVDDILRSNHLTPEQLVADCRRYL